MFDSRNVTEIVDNNRKTTSAHKVVKIDQT